MTGARLTDAIEAAGSRLSAAILPDGITVGELCKGDTALARGVAELAIRIEVARREYRLQEEFTRDAEGLLELLPHTTQCPPYADFYVPEYFRKTRRDWNDRLTPPPDNVKILSAGYTLPNIHFGNGRGGGKREINITARDICSYGLSREVFAPSVIIASGRNNESVTVQLGHIWHLLKQQPSGEPGPLLIDGHYNRFFAETASGMIVAIWLAWRQVEREQGWIIESDYAALKQVRWMPEDRFFIYSA
jgi:hypothetical protein